MCVRRSSSVAPHAVRLKANDAMRPSVAHAESRSRARAVCAPGDAARPPRLADVKRALDAWERPRPGGTRPARELLYLKLKFSIQSPSSVTETIGVPRFKRAFPGDALAIQVYTKL